MVKAVLKHVSFLKVDILAASEDMNAITSMVFWDGPKNTVGGHQEAVQEEWWKVDCACCYDDSVNSVSRKFCKRSIIVYVGPHDGCMC